GVEARRDGVAIFLQGCCGQINMGHQVTDSYYVDGDADRIFKRAEQIGSAVGEAALSALTKTEPIQHGTVDVTAGRAWLPLGPVADNEQLRTWIREWTAQAHVAK